MIVLMLAQAITAVVAPPAPPLPAITAPRVAMPMVMMDPRANEHFAIDARVDAGDVMLWEGPLRVASNVTTSIRHEQNEPPETPCPVRTYGGSAANSFNLSLAPAYGQVPAEGATAVQVTVRWSRPSPTLCGQRQASRTIEFTETASLRPGRAVTIAGDGGLRVTLRRR